MRKTMTHSLTKRAVWAALFALLLCLFAGAAVAAESADGFQYTDNGDGTCTVTGYKSNVSSLTIPETIDGLTVTAIGDSAFEEQNNYYLKTVVLPDTVTSIGNYAFKSTIGLASINMPASLESIGEEAFCYSGLTEAVFPETLTSIGNKAFRYCSKLVMVEFPKSNGSVSIGEQAFYGCDLLASVQLPEGLISIGTQGFYYCTVLTTVNLPSTLISIGDYAFQNCYELTGITLPKNLTELGKSAFYQCRGLNGSLIVPSGVATIGDRTFYDCSFDTVYLADGVTALENSVFYGCDELTTVRLPQSLASLGETVFYSCDNLAELYLPNNISSAQATSFATRSVSESYYSDINLHCVANSTTAATLDAVGIEYTSIPVHEIATAADGTKEVTINGTVDAAAWASIKSECGDSAISALYIADGAVLTNPGSLSGIKVTNAGTIDGAFTLYDVVNEKTGVISGSYEKEDGDFYFDSSIQGEIENYGTITALSLGSATVKLNEGTIRVAATYNVWEWDEGYGWGTREKLVEYGKPVSEAMGVGGWYTYSGEFANDMIVGLSGNTYYQQWIIRDGVMNVQPMGSNNTKPVQITSDMLTDVTQIVVEMGTIAVDSISIPVVLQNTKCDDGVYYTSALAGGTYNGDITVESAAEIGNSTINGNLILQSHCVVKDTTTFGSGAKVTVTGSLGSISNNWKPNGYPYTYNMDLTIAEGGSVSVNSVFTGKVTNYGKISNGTYKGTVINYGAITGGTFNGTLKDYSAHEHAPGGSETSVSWTRWDGSSELSLSSGDNYIALAGDVSYRYNIAVNTGVHLYLCLDGYDLISSYAGDVITVSGGTLTLCDCAGNKGSITHAADVTGRGVLVNAGSFNMYGGCVANNLCLSDGAGVCASNSGVFTMYDGKITGNNDGTNNFIHGGGVMADYGGTFIMYGGEISGNTATRGGGVRVSNNYASMQLHGGSITGNTASDHGGGVYLTGNCTFEMDGGAITGNTAGAGGGVFDNASTTTTPCFTMTGGSITNNTATVDAAGVDGAVKLSGSPVISGNKLTDGTASNLGSTGLINPLSGEFTGTVYVNPTLPSAGASTSFVQRTDGELTEADLACFHADNASYKLYLNEDGLGVLGFPTYQLTLTGAVFADGSSTKAIAPGTTVQFRAVVPEKKYFRSWTRADGRAIESTDSVLTFAMPPADVSVSAVFVDEFEIEDGTLVSYNGNDKVVTLPETVTAVAEGAFDRATAMETLIIPVACNLQNKLDGIAPETVLRLFVSSGLLKAVENAGPDIVLPADIIAIYSNTFNGSEIVSIYAPAVNAAGSLAFSHCPNLTTVDLPLLLTVSESLFYNTPSLSDVNLPRATAVESHAFYTSGISTLSLPNVVTIGDNAFSSSTISSISIPNVESIGNNAFANCQSLTTFSAPNLTSLDKEAFNFAGKLTTVSVPKLKDIPENAFKGCTKLTSFEHDTSAAHTIGDQAFLGADFATFDLTNVTSIGSLAFGSCSKLTSVIIPSAATVAKDAFEATTMQLYVSDSGYLENVKNVQPDVTLPESITSIRTEAFAGSEIVSISAPGVTEMCESSFYDCTSLTTVSLPKLETVPYSAFYGTTALASVDLTAAKVIESYAFYSSGITTLSLPAVETIETYAFYGSSITSISVPNVESIGSEAFHSCRKLTTVSMPKLKDIPDGAFASCAALTSFEHDTSAAYTIDKRAFVLTALTDFDLTNVTSIGSLAFGSCSKLTSVIIPSSATVADDAFDATTMQLYVSDSGDLQNVKNIQSDIVLPESITSIKTEAFAGSEIVSISAPGVTEMYGNSFSDCTSLTTVSLPKLETVPSRAFYGTTALASVDLTAAKVIEFNAFDSSGITTLSLPAAETIETYAFFDSSITSISVPNVESIGLGAFFSCQKLTSFSAPNLTSLGKNAFSTDIGLTTISMPKLKDIPYSAFSTCDALTSFEHDTSVAHTIGENSFALTALTDFDLTNVTSIGSRAFWAAKITTIVIPDSVTEIGAEAFPTDCIIRSSTTAYARTWAQENGYLWEHDQHAPAVLAAVAATCTETGLAEGSWCPDCEAILLAQEVIPALGHTAVEDKAVDPTCTETGLTAGTHCSVCGEVLTAQEIVPANGHTEAVDAAVSPTCTETGLTEGKHCSVCGEVLVKQEPVPATGHTEAVIPGFAPTCTETGVKDYIFCEVCEEELQAADEIPALGHTDSITLEAIAPTCTEAGRTAEHRCSVCRVVLTASETVAALGHTEYVSAEAVEATCQNDGLTAEISCSVCFAVLEPAQTVPALPHTTVIDEAVAPDCVNTGLTQGSHCGACGDVLEEQQTLPALGHTAVTDPAVAPTDYESGLTEGSHCGVCGETLVAQEVIPANFTWDGTTITAYNGTAENVVIPEGATALGNTVFKNNTTIKTVTVPASVTALGTQTFYGCTALTDVYLPENVTTIGATTFFKVTARIHASAESATAIALSHRAVSFTTEDGLILRYRVTTAGGTPSAVWAMGYCGDQTVVDLPETVNGVPLTQIGEYAFANQPQLMDVHIPDTVTVIGDYAFDGWAGSGAIFLPDEITSVGANTFPYQLCPHCRMNTTTAQTLWAAGYGYGIIEDFDYIENADGTVTITGYVHDDPEMVITEDVGAMTVTAIGADAFSESSFITSAVLPDTVASIGDRAFASCSQLAAITLPDNITFIGEQVFHANTTISCKADSITAATLDAAGYVYTAIPSYTYTNNGDGTATITGYTGSRTALVIPAEIDGLTVTAIGEYAFHNQQTLTSVVLPETVTSLEQDAFNGCSALAQITLPDGLTFLGANAFNGCSALSEIEIPAGVLFIGEEAFRNCSNLVSIDLPNGVTELYYNTFDGCTSLQSVTLPSGLTLLDSAVFQNCTSLQSIFLPASLTSISSSAFNHCDSLTATVIDGSYAHTWCVENGVAVNVTADAYAYTDNGDGTCTITGYYGADSQVKIPSTLDGLTVTALAEGMFAGDTRIQSIDLPDTITDIPAYLCDGCTQLERFFAHWTVQLNSIGSYAFRNCTSLYSSDYAVHIGEGAYQGCTALAFHSADLGDTVSIGAYAFDGCTSIERLYASNALREIGDYAFRNCSALSSLTHMDLGAEITAIGSGAFEGCTSMQNLLLPNCISAIGEDAFYANTAVQCVAGTQTEETLKAAGYAYEALGRFSYTDNGDGTCTITRCNSAEAEVVIPSEIDGLKVTAIGEYAFANHHDNSTFNNAWLTSVFVPEGVVSIEKYAFSSCRNIINIDLPTTLLYVGKCAFLDCEMPVLVFPDSVEYIGDYAFQGLTKHPVSVTLPANLQYLGTQAISGHSGLCSLTIPSTNSYYKTVDNVLYTKDGETLVCYAGGPPTNGSFTVPEGVTTIGEYAFTNSGWGWDLQNIILPSTLQVIGRGALSGSFEGLIIPYGVHTIGDNAFSSCPCMTSIVIPKTVTSIGDNCMPLYVMGPVGYVTATVIENSYAHTWCVENDIAVNVLEDVAVSYPYTDNGDGTATITGYTGTQTDVVIPATIDGLKVTAIGANAFRDNDSITSVVIPEGVTVIGTNAFWECSALQSVSLPSTLETIRDYAFSWCSSLNELTLPAATTEIGWSFFGQPTMITVDSANTAYTAIDGVLYSADLKTLKFCPDVKTGVFMIPEGTEVIDGRAFFGCDQLTELHIPASVTDVSLATGSGAFASMDALERFVVDENNSLLKTVNGALLTRDGTHLINVPMTFSGAYTVPEGVEIIRYHAFGGGITDVTLPDGVTGIGNEAFFRLPLHSINLPASITFISDHAFTDCGDFTATVRGGSYAHTWCLEHDVAVNVVYTPATEMTAIPLSRINTSGANGVVGQNLSTDGAYHILVDDEATDWNEVVTLHDQIINWGFGVSAPAGAVGHVSITGNGWTSDEEIIERLKLDAEYRYQESTESFNSLELAEYVKSAGLVSLRTAGEPEDSDMPFVHAIMWFAQDGTPICIEKMTLRLDHTTSTLYPAAPYQLDPSLVTPNAENLPGVSVDFADGVLTYTVSEEMLSSGTSYVTTQITVPEGAVGYKAGYYDDGIQSVEPGATLAHTHSCLDYSDWVSLFTGVRTEKIVLLWVDENGECLKDGGQLEVRLVSSNSGERKPWPAYASDERWQPVPADRLSISFKPDSSLLYPVHWNSMIDFLPGSVSGTGDLRWAETRYTVKAPEGAVAVRTNESGGSNFWNTYADSDYFNGFIGQSTLYPLTTDSYEVGNGIFAQLGAPHAKLELYQTHTSDPDWGGVHHLYWYDSLTATEPMLVDWIAYQQPAALLAYQTEPCLTESELGAAVIAPMFVDETGSSCALTSIEWLDRDEYAYEMYLTSPGGETISPNGQDFYLPYPDGHDANSGYAYTVYTDHGRFRGYPTAYGIRFRTTALGYVSLSWTEAQPVEPMSVNLLSFAEATPTGLVFETELSDGRMHIVYNDAATDWNSVVSYGEVLDGYVQQMVYLGWSDVRSADAFRITTGNWATDDELLAALAKCEVQTEYYLPLEERTFPIASYDAVTQTITPVSISKTIAVQWLDKNGNILCTEKVDVSSEHTSTGSFPAVMNPIDLTDAVFNAGNVEGVTWRIEENTIIYTIPEGLDATIETQVKAPEGTAFFRPSITINEYRIPLQADGMAHFHIPADPETDYSCAIAWLTEDDRVLGGGRIHIRMEIGQPAQILPIPMDRIDLDDVPFGMAMENHSTDGSVSVTIDDEATDWNKVLTFNDPLHLFDPETGDDWYANEAVNFGFHITEPEGAVKCKSVTGANWANDDALLQALRSNENLYDLSSWSNGRKFEIALIDEEAGQITTQSIGCDEWHETQPETYAILWLDADGNELFAEKLTVRMEHTNPNTVYKAEKVKLLVPAENILPNTTEQAGVSAAVADGSVTYVFTSSQPDIHTLVAAPEGAASYSVYEDSRSERYELVDGRYVYYQLSDWPEGTTELTVSDMLIWYDADGSFMDAGEITFTYVHKPIADLPALKLPAFLKQIDAEAFAGSGAQAIILPDGCESIGSRAFADCAQLQVIHIPASVTEIAEDAFDGCENLTVFAPEGSKAAVYALANDFTWFAE